MFVRLSDGRYINRTLIQLMEVVGDTGRVSNPWQVYINMSVMIDGDAVSVYHKTEESAMLEMKYLAGVD